MYCQQLLCRTIWTSHKDKHEPYNGMQHVLLSKSIGSSHSSWNEFWVVISWFSGSHGGGQPQLGVRFSVHVMHLAPSGQEQNSIIKLISSFTPHTVPFCMSATTMTFSFLICKAGRVWSMLKLNSTRFSRPAAPGNLIYSVYKDVLDMFCDIYCILGEAKTICFCTGFAKVNR